MIESEREDDEGPSFFAMMNTLVVGHRRILRWMALGGTAALLLVFTTPALYVASTSFIPQGNDAARSGLASLAGQFGLALPAGNQTLSPDFYSRLLISRALLLTIARDTFAVKEMEGRKVSFLDLFEIPSGKTDRREDRAVARLREIVTPSVAKTIGMVEVTVATPWPSVSLAITTALVSGVDDFNQRTRQGQASAERKFVEGRLAVATADLRASEDQLEHFLQDNRQFGSSPALTFQRDRFQRDVTLRQQVFTTLTQSYEDVRIREVRDTPVITLVEPPSVPSLPRARRRLASVLLGILLGGLVGALIVFASDVVSRRRQAGDIEVNRLATSIAGVRDDALRSLRRVGMRSTGKSRSSRER